MRNVKARLDEEGGYNRIGVGVQTDVKKDGTPAIQNVEMVFINEQTGDCRDNGQESCTCNA